MEDDFSNLKRDLYEKYERDENEKASFTTRAKKGQAENSYFGNLSVSIGGGVGKIGTR